MTTTENDPPPDTEGQRFPLRQRPIPDQLDHTATALGALLDGGSLPEQALLAVGGAVVNISTIAHRLRAQAADEHSRLCHELEADGEIEYHFITADRQHTAFDLHNEPCDCRREPCVFPCRYAVDERERFVCSRCDVSAKGRWVAVKDQPDVMDWVCDLCCQEAEVRLAAGRAPRDSRGRYFDSEGIGARADGSQLIAWGGDIGQIDAWLNGRGGRVLFVFGMPGLDPHGDTDTCPQVRITLTQEHARLLADLIYGVIDIPEATR